MLRKENAVMETQLQSQLRFSLNDTSADHDPGHTFAEPCPSTGGPQRSRIHHPVANAAVINLDVSLAETVSPVGCKIFAEGQ